MLDKKITKNENIISQMRDMQNKLKVNLFNCLLLYYSHQREKCALKEEEKLESGNKLMIPVHL